MSVGDPRPVGEDDLHAFIDGRLAPERRVVVETWLAKNPETAERVRADRALRERLRERLAPIAAEPIPARLRIENLHRQRASARRWLPIAAAIVLSLGAGGAGGWFTRGSLGTRSSDDVTPMTQDAVTAFRTFVVEAAHPVEVRANEEPHLVQWLSRRLDHPVRVPDLTSQGFRLMGGRVLPAGDRPAALLMYDDTEGTRLTLYSRHGADGHSGIRYAREGDVTAFSWSEGGLSYAVTARISEARLLTIAQSVDAQLRSSSN
ncbi:anti-sigma factor [Methylobacterium sp. C25]|uniref:anti-sigma factor family protein n=1 Tax=Methylobacterium sp. C25 TaxID=2721622 RepID=UPI001F1937B1|nr:anti-sigma factor [Methylobacterium sp. C25]MCE4226808.1 anti-sigma factor [Methylobacterium sp. C25]